MGHLFEKRKICHGCQGNYHSEKKGGAHCGREGKKKEVQQLLWTELDFGGILSLQDKQQWDLFSFSSLFLLHIIHPLSALIPFSTISYCLPVSLLALFLVTPSYSAPFLVPLFAPFFFSFSNHSCCSIIRKISVKSASN